MEAATIENNGVSNGISKKNVRRRKRQEQQHGANISNVVTQ